MKALRLEGLDRLTEVAIPRPSPGAGEVLIQTRAATICTSDLHDIRENPFGIKYPRVMGHEGAGIIAAVGPDVERLKSGDRVAVHPVLPCGVCDECLRGLGHLCPAMSHLGIDRDGCFAGYFVQRADRVRIIQDHISFAAGTLLEPSAVCLEAVARAGDVKGKTVLIVGDGPFGNMIARMTKKAGAGRVLVSGRTPYRLRMMPDGIGVLTGTADRFADVVILATGDADAVNASMKALRRRGRLVVFSAVHQPVPIDFFSIHVLEQEIAGACNDEDKIDEALQCLCDESLALEDVITHQLPFRNWQAAFALARNGHDEALKVTLIFD
ncbi:MAG: hypothetical protein ABS46_00350 [Cytophagaceae bacterium SCN 52-12]|nr:MAG: hypothetical protein ABS46_00350 [Cytophagaceae bacterium SCN 52-12]